MELCFEQGKTQVDLVKGILWQEKASSAYHKSYKTPAIQPQHIFNQKIPIHVDT